jgi:ERCC4-type nuclease
VNEPREPVSVVVDYRERNSGVLDALAAMPGVDVRVEHLPVGDYLVDDVFVFERKTLVDLVASIMDARLFKQACRLACDARRSAFILEGTLTQLAPSQMRREAIQGALVTITLMLGLPVLRSRDPHESARLMVYAARQAQAWSTGAIARRVRRPKGKRRAQLQMLQGLPGIGPDRAARLLDEFGSVEAVLTAAREDLLTVDGIGPVTARGIRWVVSEPTATYAGTSDR